MFVPNKAEGFNWVYFLWIVSFSFVVGIFVWNNFNRGHRTCSSVDSHRHIRICSTCGWNLLLFADEPPLMQVKKDILDKLGLSSSPGMYQVKIYWQKTEVMGQ